MSLRRAKTLYCVAAMALAILLTWTGIVLCWIAAVVLLSGALPGWSIATQAASDLGADQALSVVEHHLAQQ